MQAKKVTDVRIVGHTKTMDIEVSNESHVFYGDGIATSNSHAVSYAFNAYWSAYCKFYRRKKFYEKYLNRAEKKPKPDIEKKELIMDAKASNIEVLPPRLQHLFNDFFRHPLQDTIVYGLRHVKHVGKESEKIIEYIKETDVQNYTWMDCLIYLIHGLRLNKRATIALISVGAFNGKNNLESRQKMLYEFDSWKQLSTREQQAIVDNYKSSDPSVYSGSLSEAIDNMLRSIKVNSRRKPTVDDIKVSLDNPFYDLNDKIGMLAIDEEKYMSCSLTCSKVDGLDLNMVTNMCQDVANRVITKKANLAVEIVRIKVVKTKKGKTPGQEMAFLTVEDSSGSLEDVVTFPEAYEKYKDLLLESNTVLLMGEVNSKDKDSFIVNQVSQI